MKTQRLFRTLILSAAFVGSPVAAQTIDMGPPGFTPFLASNIGNTDRSVVFQALQTFALTSAGIKVQPIATGSSPFTLTAWLYSMTGPQTRGALLSTASQLETATALQFYDVSILFPLINGQLYDIAFTVNGDWGFGRYNMEFYNFNYPTNSAVNIDNMVSVIDGGADRASGFANFVMPHVELNVTEANTVPEPASLTLLATGMVGVFGVARRRFGSARRDSLAV